jgi:hypothetical protein
VRKYLIIVAWFVFPAVLVQAQQRPLRTDVTDPVGLGRIRVDFGLEFLQGQRFTLSGLEGDLTRVGVTSIHVGVSEFAEFQISGVVRDFLSVSRRTPPAIPPDFAGNATSDVGDLVLASKFRLATERGARPALGFKFAVQLPNASNESGIGSDVTNFHALFLASKHIRGAQILGNLGLAILGSAVQPNSQADLLTYGFGIIIPMHSKANLVSEVQGRAGAQRLGNENQSQIRAGVQMRMAGLRWDIAGIAGLEKHDPDSGLVLGVTYEFQAFNRPRSPKTIR